MPSDQTIEARVSDLEKQVKQLAREVFQNKARPGWVQKLVGSMENDPDFAQILKLGDEIRRAERDA